MQREGPVTAGRLAEATGLTTGAIDGRSTAWSGPDTPGAFATPAIAAACSSSSTPELQGGAGDFYGEHMALGRAPVSSATARSSSSCCSSSSREGRGLNERKAAELEQRNRGRASP